MRRGTGHCDRIKGHPLTKVQRQRGRLLRRYPGSVGIAIESRVGVSLAGGGAPARAPDRAGAIVGPYVEAGLTWWLEGIGPWRFGWDWSGPWPVEAMEERIRQGPPK